MNRHRNFGFSIYAKHGLPKLLSGGLRLKDAQNDPR